MSTHRAQVFLGERLVCDSSRERVTVGRGDANDVVVPEVDVSRHHGELTWTGAGWVYRDLESSNGSRRRRGRALVHVDEACAFQVDLLDGDELLLGDEERPVVLSLRLSGQPDAPAAVADDSRLGRVVEAGAAMRTILGVNRVDQSELVSLRIEEDRQSLRCLYRVLKRMNDVAGQDHLLDELVPLLAEFFPAATHVSVFLRGPSGGEAFERVRVWARDAHANQPISPPSQTLLKELTERREAVLFRDVEGFGGAESLVASKIQSGILVPLWDEQQVRGAIQLDSRAATAAFTNKDLDLSTMIGNQAALVLRSLTMTADLRRLNEELAQALRRIELLDRAKRHLAKFVPETVKKLVEASPDAPELAAMDADASVLFLDIGGYTKLTEALDRDQVSFLVETYFSSFIDDIYANGGDINETAGDGLMIIFQAPEPEAHARNAVRAAVAIRRKTREVNERLTDFDPIHVNMGINTGVVTVGSRRIEGLAGSRWTYTATGMVTNVSARLGAHATQGQILIGPETAERVRSSVTLGELGPVQFKNVSKPMSVFEVLDGK